MEGVGNLRSFLFVGARLWGLIGAGRIKYGHKTLGNTHSDEGLFNRT